MDKNDNIAQKQPRTFSGRALVVVSLLVFLVTTLMVAGSVGLAFWSGAQNSGSTTTEQQRQTVVQEGEVIAEIAKEVDKSVVSIVTEQQTTTDSFFGVQRRAQGAGTGLIIDSNGLILTNKHVVPEGSSVEVITHDGTTHKDVQIVGRDPLNDLAILKVRNPKDFTPTNLGDSDKVRTGQKVIAIGNALGQFQNTVTSGIISGMGRPVTAGDSSGANIEQLTNLFQTDAAINSGNSGGPLLDFNGDVIGVNTAIAAGAQNIGFAIPINEAKGIIDSVKTTGKLSRPYIGVRYVTLTPAIAQRLDLSVKQGAYIPRESGSIIRGGPANKAGLRAGDVITKVGGTSLNDRSSLTSAIARHKVGETIKLTIIRGEEEQTLELKLAEAPRQ